LTQCIEQNKLGRVTSLAKNSNVELMTHPIVEREAEYLMSDEFPVLARCLNVGGYEVVLSPPSFYHPLSGLLPLTADIPQPHGLLRHTTYGFPPPSDGRARSDNRFHYLPVPARHPGTT